MAEAAIQLLLDRYDELTAAILVDPRVAGDPSNATVVAFLDLFEPGSTFAGGTIKFWADEGAKGRFYKAGPSGRMFKSTVLTLTANDDTLATAFVCTVQSVSVVSQSGTVLESLGGVNGAEAIVTKVGGGWRIRSLTVKPPGDCPKPGAQP